jgi:hypothetical protein
MLLPLSANKDAIYSGEQGIKALYIFFKYEKALQGYKVLDVNT